MQRPGAENGGRDRGQKPGAETGGRDQGQRPGANARGKRLRAANDHGKLNSDFGSPSLYVRGTGPTSSSGNVS